MIDSERIQSTAVTIYRTLTPASLHGTVLAFFIVVFGWIVLTGFLAGVLAGGSVAVSGEALSTVISQMHGVEQTVWVAMGTDGNVLTRSVYGFFHFITALMVWAGVVGIHLGHAVPNLAPVASVLLNALTALVVVLVALQLVRLLELATGHRIVAREIP